MKVTTVAHAQGSALTHAVVHVLMDVEEHVVLVALLIVHPVVVLEIAILHVTQSAQQDALSHVGIIASITVTQIVQGFVLRHVGVIAIGDVPQIAKTTALIHVIEIAILAVPLTAQTIAIHHVVGIVITRVRQLVWLIIVPVHAL